jgi:hypothetical protein
MGSSVLIIVLSSWCLTGAMLVFDVTKAKKNLQKSTMLTEFTSLGDLFLWQARIDLLKRKE